MKIPEPIDIPRGLLDRVVSGFNLSIATGLAMETLFEPDTPVADPDREVPEKMILNKDYLFMINCETLLRNLIGAVSKEVYDRCEAHHLAYILLEEIRVIESLCSEEGGGYLTPVFYVTDYDKITGYIHRSVKKRTAKTDLQIFNKKKIDKALEYLRILRPEISHYTNKSDFPKSDSCMMLSHYPYDLLFYKNFREMLLLESHTGKIKSRIEWNTKYFPFPGADMSKFPFNRTLLMVFGDRIMFHPHLMQMRKYIVDTAEKGKWTPLTTRDKILMDCRRYIPEPYVVAVIAAL